MSAIAGLVDLHGGPLDAGLVARMIAPPRPCGLEVRGPVRRSGAVLAFCGRPARAATLDQPLIDSDADCAIVFDGRIDNPRDVAAWLGVDPRAARTDARLVLAGYTRRGTDVIAQLSGDFAFAIWDGRQRRLLLARDPFGVRQVCFAPVGDGLAFATDARQLLEIDEVDRRPNMGFFAEWMAGWITHPSDTIYRGIHRVPAAHFVTAGAAGVRRERYWDIDPERRVRCRDDAEYAEQFRELFAASVRSRLRPASRVAIALSGGIDSSAIAAMAAHVTRTHPTELRAYHVSYPGLPEANEERYARAAADAHGVPLVTIPYAGKSADDYLRVPRMLRDMAPGGVGVAELPFYERMAADGCDLVLDGNWADEWFTGTYYHAADLLRQGRLVAAVGRLREHASHSGSIHAVLRLAEGAVWTALPPALRRAIKRVTPARDVVPRLFRRDFAASVHLVERITQPNYDDRFPTFAAGAVYRDATCELGTYSWHEDVRLAAAFGLEASAPFGDRALAEFAAALPEEQRWSRGRAKHVMRNGMKELMPPRILERDSKGNGSEAQVAELGRLHDAGAFDDLQLAEAGVVDAGQVEPMFRLMNRMFSQHDRHYEVQASHLWLLFIAESAWRALFVEEGLTWNQNASHKGTRNATGKGAVA
jgi:asparagine synthase (glutamine-hydrolysing)